MIAGTERTYNVYFCGIDPSATSTGYALVGEASQYVYAGKILPKKLRGGERLAFIRKHITQFLHPYRDRVKFVVIEAPAYDKPLKADLLGQIRGLFLLTCFDLEIPTLLVAPTAVKKFATGSGAADKLLMVKTARKHWPQWTGTDKDDDEADALWMAELARGTAFPKGLTRPQLEVLYKLNHLEVEDDV